MKEQSISDLAKVEAQFSSELKLEQEIKRLNEEVVTDEKRYEQIGRRIQVLQLALELKR